jgi:predicted DNA-binding protein (UPF0251 family)
MNIQQEREYILSENNTAQQQFIDLLEYFTPSSTKEIRITEPLSGELDFSILNGLGFHHIKAIYLGDGKITQISNLPKTLVQFHCGNQLLTTLNGLPTGIKQIDVSHNYLSDIELQGLTELVKLNCSHNQLTELNNLPATLEELYCVKNDIHRLDLAGLTELRVLHCSDNKLMLIQNVPDRLDELRMENNPMAEIEHIPRNAAESKEKRKQSGSSEPDDAEIKIDYVEAIREYFNMKQKYEKKRLDMKRAAFEKAGNKKRGKLAAASVQPRCINCLRKVGTIFDKRDNKYIAICGDTKDPCNLNIQLYSGHYYNHIEMYVFSKEILEESKESIIKQKLDTLFNFITESYASNAFKKELANYQESSEIYKDFDDKYEQTYHNMHKQELLIRKHAEFYEVLETIQGLMEEYKKTGEKETLKTAMQTYKEQVLPKIEHIRRLKYEVIEVLEENEVSRLVQLEAPVSKVDFTFDAELPHVIRFTKK